VLDKYALLPSGASMGDGYGPLLVASRGKALPDLSDDLAVADWLQMQRIAVPGKMTSAWLALQLFMGTTPMAVEVPFDRIFDYVKCGNADVGLIIHEGQLTYGVEGFQRVADLGDWWKRETGLPLPLGGNVVRKDFSREERSEINRILSASIAYGLEHRVAGVRHAMPLARGMDETLADQFIGMYVNDYTLDYGDKGRAAIREFLGRAALMKFIPAPVELEFVE
jgi:1,4-dihydroxy-6-naphthoate synthase